MRRGRPRHPELLTPREQEVLSLIREGLTNEQIAHRLGISESGARYHVSEILSKLGVESREQAAAYRVQYNTRRLAGLATGSLVPRLESVLPFGARRIAAVLIALGLSVMLLLGITLVVADSRGGQTENGSSPGQRVDDPVEVADLIRLADEARREAQTYLPSAKLYLLAYATPSRLYTFRFSAEGSLNEVTLVGPYVGDPAFQRWEAIEEVRPQAFTIPPPLDLTALLNMPLDVAEAASVQAPISPRNAGVILWSENGQLQWVVSSRVGAGLVRCEVVDSPSLTSFSCDLP